MFTTVCWSQSLDSAVLAELDGVSDPHIRVEGKNIIIPEGMNNLLGVYAVGPSLTGVQLASPSLRRRTLLDVPVFHRADAGGGDYRVEQYFYNPIALDEFEGLRALASEDGTGATRVTVFAWIGDGPRAEVSGDIFTIRCTISGTATTFAWTNFPLTITQTLPAGRYAMVGGRVVHANIILARFVFVGHSWRPGIPGVANLWEPDFRLFRRGALGVFGEFPHDQPPTVDVFANAATISASIFLDLMRV